HALWQGALVALLLAILLRVTRRASAALRYALSCIALAVAFGLAGTTAWSVSADWAEHRACWSAAALPGAAVTERCAGHGVLKPEHTERYEALARGVRPRPSYAAALRLTEPLGWAAA